LILNRKASVSLKTDIDNPIMIKMNELKYYLYYLDNKILLDPESCYSIGRDDGNAIQLPDQTASRKHARIIWKDGHFVIEDLDSTNGVFINGRKSANQILYDGDHIVIGTFYLVYREYEKDNDEKSDFESSLTDTILIEHQISQLLKSISDKKIREKVIDLKISMNNVKSKLDKLANRDRLTKLYNRRYFDEELKKEFERAERYKFSISLFMIDIDDFKKINDTYGHQKGDLVLSGISSIIAAKIRLNDLAARYGGEEFVVIIPEISSGNSLNIAEKIRKQIESDSLKKTGIKVTVSIGSATKKKNDTPESLIKKADKALYEAKKSGKNRVISFDKT
jgi:diguanylate cyclase (GGDEF)-like protein